MQTALPAAITMVVTLLVVQVLSPFWKETEVFTYTFDLPGRRSSQDHGRISCAGR